MRPRQAGRLGLLLALLLAFVGLTAEMAAHDGSSPTRPAAAYDGPVRMPSANWDSHDLLLPSAIARPGSSASAPDAWAIADPAAVTAENVVCGWVPYAGVRAWSVTGVLSAPCRAPPST